MIENIHQFYSTVTEYPHLCKSCGMCAGICPTSAVTMVKNEFQQYIPLFDSKKCIDCRKCIEVCPGIDITEYADSIVGDFKNLYIAWSRDEKTRTLGSSGGVISSLASWMLKDGIVKKAILLNSKNSPITPRPVVVTSPEDVINSIGSKYISYPICDIANKFDKHSLITTLPCQTLAIKKSGRELGFIFGLFCSKAYTSDLATYICKQEGIENQEIINIDYRKGDWPGFVSIETKYKSFDIPYNRSYFTGVANSNYFTIQGCLLCPDYFNEFSDISFGDPWGFQIDDELKKGKTLLISRTAKGQSLIDQAISNGIIIAEKITHEKLINGHTYGIYFKKQSIRARLDLFLDNNLPIPDNNIEKIKSFNLLSNFVQKFYFKNNVLLKKTYEKIFKTDKLIIFIKRYFFHIIQTLIIKFSKRNYYKENK